jgi:hypothetical protein
LHQAVVEHLEKELVARDAILARSRGKQSSS